MSKQTTTDKAKVSSQSTNNLLATSDPLGAAGLSKPQDASLSSFSTTTSGAVLAAVTLPTPSKPDLAASSDTGSSSADDVTRNTTLTLSGSAAARATVTIKDGATVLGSAVASSSGKWTFTTAILAQGPHSFTATATDKSGNTSAPSSPLTVVIDTTAPAAPAALDLAPADDSGAAADDNVTNRTSGLTVSGAGEVGALVTIYDDANNNGVRNTGEATLATTTISATGVFAVDVALGAGVHYLLAFQTDPAGNTGGSSAALTVTVDTTAPSAPAGLDLAAADDTGASSSDNLTSLTTGLTISGLGENASTVTLYDDADNDGVRDVTEAALGTAAVTAGAFSLDIALSAGLHHVRSVQADLAGNVSVSSTALNITVEAPPPPAWITLASVTADNIVKTAEVASAQVPLTGTVGGEVDPGDIVSVTVGGTTYSGAVQPDGTFSIDAPGSAILADSNARIEASVTTLVDGADYTATDSQSYWLNPSDIFGGVTAFSSTNGQKVMVGGLQYTVQNGNAGWSIANPDSDTLRFEVHSGDQWKNDANNRERSEIAGGELYTPDDIITMNYDFTVEPGTINTAPWAVLGQFHANDLTTSPPFAVEMKGERMAIMVRYLDGNNKYGLLDVSNGFEDIREWRGDQVDDGDVGFGVSIAPGARGRPGRCRSSLRGVRWSGMTSSAE